VEQNMGFFSIMKQDEEITITTYFSTVLKAFTSNGKTSYFR
jgi:hypothetical protein